MISESQAGEPIILASASPRRQELIRMLGLPVTLMPGNADETTPAHWTPRQIVEGLSERKAAAAAEKLQDVSPRRGIVVGSDTIVVLDGKVMGKPSDEQEAERMLRELAGATHEVYTGVTCLRLSDGRTATSHRITRVKMRPLSSGQISRYVATGEPLDKAGAYGIQGLGALLVESIEGCYFNVVGLPLSLLAVQLEQFDITLP